MIGVPHGIKTSSALVAWNTHPMVAALSPLSTPHTVTFKTCFRVTHPPFCRMSFPDLVPLCCLLLTCERNRCLYT